MSILGGASSDLMGATSIAKAAVRQLGMSEKIGLRVYQDPGTFGEKEGLGPGTAELIDNEINRMLNDSYKRAASILK